MVSLDTNAVLSLMIKERVDQRTKVTELLSGNICYISDMVFPEIEYALTKVYGFPRQNVAASINMVMAYQNTRCNVGLLIEALGMYVNNPALSFVDCCLAVEASLSKKKPLYTFDKKLANQSGGLAKLLT